MALLSAFATLSCVPTAVDLQQQSVNFGQCKLKYFPVWLTIKQPVDRDSVWRNHRNNTGLNEMSTAGFCRDSKVAPVPSLRLRWASPSS